VPAKFRKSAVGFFTATEPAAAEGKRLDKSGNRLRWANQRDVEFATLHNLSGSVWRARSARSTIRQRRGASRSDEDQY